EAAEACGLVPDDGAQQAWATIDSGGQAGRAQPRMGPQPQARSQAQPQPVHAQSPQQTAPRPIIHLVAGQLPRILTEIEDALLASGLPIFARAGTLVEPISETMLAADGRKTIVVRLHVFSPDSLLGLAAEAMAFQKYDGRRNAWIEVD